MGKKSTKRKAATAAAANARPQIYYRIHTLLETVREIAQHEDQLCCLMHEIKSKNSLSPSVSRELRSLLEEMAPADYDHNLSAVWLSLEGEHSTR